MSKLDDILNDINEAEGVYGGAKQQIKDLFLELIGEDLDSERQLDTDGITQFRVSVVARGINRDRAKLRQKVKDL